MAILRSICVPGGVKYVLEGRSDVQPVECCVFPTGVNPVGQKDVGEPVHGVGPDKGARKARMAKTLRADQRGGIGLLQGKQRIVQKRFVKAQGAPVPIFGILYPKELPEGVLRYQLLSIGL